MRLPRARRPGPGPAYNAAVGDGATTLKQLMTAEELWAIPEATGVRHELVEGELVEAPGAGVVHNLIAALI